MVQVSHPYIIIGKKYWSGLPFPPPLDHILLELFTMTCPFWVALYGMTHSFLELLMPLYRCKAMIQEGSLCVVIYKICTKSGYSEMRTTK